MQLTMFIDPAEIVANTLSGEWDSVDGIDSEIAWRDKQTRAFGGGHRGHNFHSIASWKVFKPITLWVRGDTVTMGNGHHRVAASKYFGMSLIPVLWDTRDYFAGYPSPGAEDIELPHEMNYV